MVFRNMFNEPRPKGFLEIGEVLNDLEIDVDDRRNLTIIFSYDPKDEPKFNEIVHGFSAEVLYVADDELAPVTFTTLGYRTLAELIRDLRAAAFNVDHYAQYDMETSERDIIIYDDPDESTVTTITSKGEDFAEIRDEACIAFVAEEAYGTDPVAYEYTPLSTEQENPDMTMNKELFAIVGALTASIHRVQTELLETSRIAQTLTAKLGTAAFAAPVQATSHEIVMHIDGGPLAGVLKELQDVISGADVAAQHAVEGEDIPDEPDTSDDPALPEASEDFDEAIEDALATNVAATLAITTTGNMPQPLPLSPEFAPHADQSDDAKDFRAICAYFLNVNSGERDGIVPAVGVFNATWNLPASAVKADVAKNLIKVAQSKLIWTSRLTSLFKRFVDTELDAVLYGTTSPVTMKLVKDADGTYGFIKV